MFDCGGMAFSEAGFQASLGMSLKVVSIGLLAAFFAAQMGLDFGGRKNEPIVRWIVCGRLVGEILVFVHFQNLGGIVELALFICAALGLDLAE